jgi:hypothetical protein
MSSSGKRGRGRPPGSYGRYRRKCSPPPSDPARPVVEQDKLGQAKQGIREGYAVKEKREIIANLSLEARKHAEMALDSLIDLARNAKNEGVRLSAVNSLLDRGYGKPSQSIDLKTDGPQIQVNLFEGIPAEDQRLVSETLAAIQSNPAALALALEVMNDPAAMTVAVPDDVIDPAPERMWGEFPTSRDAGDVIDLKAEPVED